MGIGESDGLVIQADGLLVAPEIEDGVGALLELQHLRYRVHLRRRLRQSEMFSTREDQSIGTSSVFCAPLLSSSPPSILFATAAASGLCMMGVRLQKAQKKKLKCGPRCKQLVALSRKCNLPSYQITLSYVSAVSERQCPDRFLPTSAPARPCLLHFARHLILEIFAVVGLCC